jgi:hypothetical protein
MPLPDLVEVGARPVEIDRSGDGFTVGAGTGPDENQQGITSSYDLAGRHQAPDGPQRVRRDEHVLHLHRLEYDELISGAEVDTVGHYLDHGAGQLRTQRFLARVEFDRHDPGVVLTRQRSGSQLGQSGVNEIGGHGARLKI